jgi:hypothetical protein
MLQRAIVGFSYNRTINQPVFNMATNLASSSSHLATYGSFVNKSASCGDFTYPGVSIGQHTYPAITNTTLNLGPSTGAGCIAFRGVANGTWTLPAITTNHVGMTFEVANCSVTPGVTLAVQTSSSQLMNMQTAKTSYSLALGQWIKVTAQEDGSGGWFWQTMTNGT